MKVRILVYPRQELLDPQGQAVGAALRRGGFSKVQKVRVGKCFFVDLDVANMEHARKEAEQMAADLLANPVTEEFLIELPEDQGP